MLKQIQKFSAEATVIVAVAFVVISCANKLKATGELAGSDTPVQVVEDMEIIQSDKGNLKIRMTTPRMERYANDTLEWELFPKGFIAYAYDETGKLETRITARNARHQKLIDKKDGELWEACDSVVITNLKENRIMETDTLYWDPDMERIYTRCYVRIVDPKGMMQGYGMESDQRARHHKMHKVFNNYGIITQDSTQVVIDSANFIGPFPKK